MAGNIHTIEEQYKFDVITKVIKKEIKSGLAAKLLSLSTRQVRRLKISVKENGISAIVHMQQKNYQKTIVLPSVMEPPDFG